MTKIIYVTHPSVFLDKTKPPQLWDLSEKGRFEAEDLREQPFWSEVQSIYSSKEPKAITTAQIILEKFSFPYTSIAELGEGDRTATPFLPLDEYMSAVEFAYNNPSISHLGWESHNHTMKRNVQCLEKIMEMNSDECIAIIGQGGAGTLIKCFIKGIEPSFDEDPKQTGCYWIANWEEKKILQDWIKY